MSAPFEFPALAEAAFNYPAIDNHAHPLLTEIHRNLFSFDGLLSEARGDALRESVNTLASFRATRQLSKLFECEDDWDTVKECRARLGYDELCNRCFEKIGIYCILLDNGLDGERITEEVGWHDRFAKAPSKQIVRIETSAQDILVQIVTSTISERVDDEDLCQIFIERIHKFLNTCAEDPNVVAFKSIACYRTGLGISPIPLQEPERTAVLSQILRDALPECREKGKIRFSSKPLIDFLVQETMKIAGKCQKPVQFHTGLGDADLTLALSTPSLLQPLIAAHPNTPVVLLHGSYPFTQEAGYLASVYANVYLDFGEVFPFVSAAGQRKVVELALELCPTTKILWSTDGHWWPETYYLGSIQAREALYEVLSEYTRRGHISEVQAVRIVQRALFENANKLYRLDLEVSTNNSPGHVLVVSSGAINL